MQVHGLGRGPGGKRKKSTWALHEAGNAAEPARVLQLLQEGHDANALDDCGFNPLHWSAGPQGSMQVTRGRSCCGVCAPRVGSG